MKKVYDMRKAKASACDVCRNQFCQGTTLAQGNGQGLGWPSCMCQCMRPVGIRMLTHTLHNCRSTAQPRHTSSRRPLSIQPQVPQLFSPGCSHGRCFHEKPFLPPLHSPMSCKRQTQPPFPLLPHSLLGPPHSRHFLDTQDNDRARSTMPREQTPPNLGFGENRLPCPACGSQGRQTPHPRLRRAHPMFESYGWPPLFGRGFRQRLGIDPPQIDADPVWYGQHPPTPPVFWFHNFDSKRDGFMANLFTLFMESSAPEGAGRRSYEYGSYRDA